MFQDILTEDFIKFIVAERKRQFLNIMNNIHAREFCGVQIYPAGLDVGPAPDIEFFVIHGIVAMRSLLLYAKTEKK